MRELLDYEKMVRTIRRISHEIIERNSNLENIVFLGIKKNGVPLAKMISKNIEDFEQIQMTCLDLDISGYRDDKKIEVFDKLTVDLTDKTVIVVDDVLFTGRSVRASMDAIIDLGRPEKIQLAVLIDRGHRELPIRADYVGKSIPTNLGEKIIVRFSGEKGVFITNKEEI
ncbi:MAG: bifunctional pyr operon transcriptional regulator/uracil phosphoribosyltransferase PyrR [Firmicutes bacterium]|nr:bifunctional pyr operon transcriptional regulator/uracil phosphoribosyltransferase PyrR [Bacillota bacterium]